MKKIFAFIKKEILNEMSYRFAIFLEILSIFFLVLIFYFISKLFTTNPSGLVNYGGDYFSFVLIGLAFSSYFGAGLNSFSGNLRREQMMGTLESIFSTPTKSSTIIFSISVWNFIYITIQVVVFLVLGKLMGVDFSNARLGSAIIIFILTLTSFSSIGILGASFIMIFKRGDPVNWVVGNLFDLLGGVYFPAGLLPHYLQEVSRFLPITHALKGLRLSLFQGYTLVMLLPEIIFLSVFSAIAFPLSLLFFGYSVKKARINATLSQY